MVSEIGGRGNKIKESRWAGGSNITGYMVYIGESDGAYGTPIRTTSTTYTFQNLQALVFVAAAVDAAGGSILRLWPYHNLIPGDLNLFHPAALLGI